MSIINDMEPIDSKELDKAVSANTDVLNALDNAAHVIDGLKTLGDEGDTMADQLRQALEIAEKVQHRLFAIEEEIYKAQQEHLRERDE